MTEVNRTLFVEACSDLNVGVLYFKENSDGSVIAICVFESGLQKTYDNFNAKNLIEKIKAEVKRQSGK